MPLFDMTCKSCEKKEEYIISFDTKIEEVQCTNCGKVGDLVKEMSFWGSYAIKGDNSGSTKRKITR